MSTDSTSSSSQVRSRCRCGVALALRKSWTAENPGRRFLGCKFYNLETKNRGCGYFKWFDTHQTDWQRVVINELVFDKEMLKGELKREMSTVLHLEERAKMLGEENEVLRRKAKFFGFDVVEHNPVASNRRPSTIPVVLLVLSAVMLAFLAMVLLL